MEEVLETQQVPGGPAGPCFRFVHRNQDLGQMCLEAEGFNEAIIHSFSEQLQ